MYNHERLTQMIREWSESFNSCTECPCHNTDYCQATIDNFAEWMCYESIFNWVRGND